MLFCIGNDSSNDLVIGFVQGPPHLQMNRQKQTRLELTDTFPILHNPSSSRHNVECSEKDQNCKLQFPQPDY